MRCVIQPIGCLIHRIREQARSHSFVLRFTDSFQSSLMVMFGIAGVAASCNTIRAPTWRASS